MSSLALAYAWLCLDCDLIMDVRQARTCPQCGGSAWWPIARWLQRSPMEVTHGSSD